MNANNENFPRISSTIPARLRNIQEPQIIKTCKEQGIKFTDPLFPTNGASLIGNPAEPGADRGWTKLKWARAEDVFGRGEFAVFNDIHPDDIRQGGIGNCYFLCALSSLAEQPGLIKRLFDTTHPNDYAVYALWLNIDGMWKEFILDDYFPVEDNGRGAVQFAFSRTNEDEIWVMLLEKAYAKAYGNYHRVVGGDPVHALRDLTGAPFERIEDMKSKSPDEVFNRIARAEKAGYILCCYTQGTHITEEQQSNGLVSGHAYSLLRAEEVAGSDGRRHKILQIRNPWGGFEWKGDWSDGSRLWTPEARRRYEVEQKDDGVFWMSIEDFIRFFEGVGICKVNPMYRYNSVKVDQGGSSNKTLIRFDVYSGGNYTMSVDQRDCRHFSGDQYSCAYVRITIGRLTSRGIEFVDCMMTPERNIFCEEKIPAGSYVALIEAYWEGNFTRQFVFSVYGPEMAGIKKGMTDDAMFESAEYQIWKDFGQSRPELFNDEGRFPIADGYELSKSGFQSQDFAMSLSKWTNHSNQGTVQQVIRTKNCVGFDVVSEHTSGDQHTLKMSPGSSEVVVFKMDPRNDKFQSSIETVDIDVVRGDVPDDMTAVDRLRALEVMRPEEGPMATVSNSTFNPTTVQPGRPTPVPRGVDPYNPQPSRYNDPMQLQPYNNTPAQPVQPPNAYVNEFDDMMMHTNTGKKKNRGGFLSWFDMDDNDFMDPMSLSKNLGIFGGRGGGFGGLGNLGGFGGGRGGGGFGGLGGLGPASMFKGGNMFF